MNGTARIVRDAFAAVHLQVKLLCSSKFNLRTISLLVVETKLRGSQGPYEVTN